MDDLNFCSSCLICTKLCVHPKARLKLNDCNLKTTTKRTRPTSRTSKGSPKNQKKTSVEKQVLSFQKNASKFCELFNSPTDTLFQKDFNEFFKFSTLSSNCPVCEDCQQRIKLISKVMVQIETLQSQLMKLKNSVEKDLSVQITAENVSKHILNSTMRFFIDGGVKTRLFRETLKEKLQISSAGSKAVDINDVINSTKLPKLNGFDPNTYAVLLEGLDVVPEENWNDLSLHCDDEYFDLKPDPDHGDDIDDTFYDNISCWDHVQPNQIQNEKNKLDVDHENDIQDRTNSHAYVSLEVQGTTCTLTLSNLEEPVVIDDSMTIECSDDSDEHQISSDENLISKPETEANFSMGELGSDATTLVENVRRPRARSKSIKMYKKGSSSEKGKMLKCTFVDPVKGKCRVKVLDHDRWNAHVNRSHKNIAENLAYECSLCPFAAGTVKRLYWHRKQHGGNKDNSCETTTSTPDINCHDEIQQPLDHKNDELMSEIECDFDPRNQSSDSPDVNLIAGINHPETDYVAHTLILNQQEEPKNSDVDLLQLQSAKNAHVSDSKTKLKSTSQAKSGSDARVTNVQVTKSDLSIRKPRRPTKGKLKRDKPAMKRVRDTSTLLQCTHVDPVKGKCRWKLLDQDRLDAHINRHHKKIPEGKSFMCNVCPFATRRMQYLTFHKKIHAGIKDVTCEVCGMSFRTENYLLHHKRRKHGEPFPFNCNICEKGFNDAYELKMHNYRNHAAGADYTHPCLVCDEGFYSTIHLNSHMLRHAERTFKCDECPKAYQTKQRLQRHTQETHTGVRPFACDFCSWKFYSQQKLDNHRSVHTNKRPFLCQQCGFSSRLPDLLKAHLKVHENNHSLAEQGIEKAPRLAKPRNRRLKSFETIVPPLLPTETEISAELSVESNVQQVESEVAME